MKLLVVIVCSLLTFTVIAQKTEGVIQYKETIKLDIDLDGIDGLTEEMKSMFPSEQSMENRLNFNKNASLYTNSKETIDESVDYKSEDEDVQIMVQMDMPEHAYYKDLKSKEIVESQDLFGKKFLISGDKKMKWKIAKDQKKVLNFDCKKATAKTADGKIIEAWFTTGIPLPIGPGGYHDLPGAVLAVSVDGGKHTITATKVDFKKIDSKQLAKPKKGKKVTYEAFTKIAAEKQKEMAEMYGGSGNIIMKTETIER